MFPIAVNRGNSRGPTFDLDGNVIGVNTAIYSLSGGNVGIAFDIRAYTVKSVVAQLRDHRLLTAGLRVGHRLAHVGGGGNRAVHIEDDVPGLEAVARVLSGSICVTATPSPRLRAGASERPTWGTSLAGASRPSVSARACRLGAIRRGSRRGVRTAIAVDAELHRGSRRHGADAPSESRASGTVSPGAQTRGPHAKEEKIGALSSISITTATGRKIAKDNGRTRATTGSTASTG
jgi:hypothetical protein